MSFLRQEMRVLIRLIVVVGFLLAPQATVAEPPKESPVGESVDELQHRLHQQLGQFQMEQARKTADQLRIEAAKKYGDKTLEVAVVVDAQALIAERTGQREAAVRLRREATAIYREKARQQPWRIRLAEVLEAVAVATEKLDEPTYARVRAADQHKRKLVEAGRRAEAGPPFLAAAALAELRRQAELAEAIDSDVFGKDSYRQIENVMAISQAEGRRGQFAESAARAEQADQIVKQLLGPRHPERVKTLYLKAHGLAAQGNNPSASLALHLGLAIQRETGAEGTPGYADALDLLGTCRLAMGDFASADRYYRKAMAINVKLGEQLANGKPVDARNPTILQRIALLSVILGDREGAAKMADDSLVIARRTYANYPSQLASHVHNAGRIHHLAGNLPLAESHYLEARKLLDGRPAANRWMDGVMYLALGSVQSELSKFEAAEANIQRANELWETDSDRARQGFAVSESGLLEVRRGNAPEAEKQLKAALQQTEELLGEHRITATIRLDLARALLAQKRPAEARKLLAQSLATYQQFLRAALGVQTYRQRLALLSTLRESLDLYLTASLEMELDEVEPLYDQVLQWKGLLGARRTAESARFDQPESQVIWRELAQARAQFSQLAFAVPTGVPPATWKTRLRQAEQQTNELERKLAHPVGSAVDPMPTADELKAAISESFALVDYLAYDHYRAPQPGKDARSERRLLAWVSRRGRAARLVRLGPLQPLESAIFHWREAFETRPAVEVADRGKKVTRRLWSPLADTIRGCDTILIAADGPVCQVPFAALPTDEGKSPTAPRYLLEEVALAHVADARQLLAERNPRQTPTDASRSGLLAIGAIDYQHQTSTAFLAPSDRDVLSLRAPRGPKAPEPLPATRWESEQVVQRFRRKYESQQSVLLSDADADEARIREALSKPFRYLHFAGHGFFAPPGLVSALSSGKSDARLGAVQGFDPQILSGLVLAGAADDATVAPAGSDGVLTAAELQVLDLRSFELIVLSGCSTGLGSVADGEGLLGLQRALQHAGAVVASLWDVDDAATSVLMEQFYDNLWEKGRSKLQALRQAQLFVLRHPDSVLLRGKELQQEARRRAWTLKPRPAPLAAGKRRSPPDWWAAFTLSGDWR